MPLLPEERVEQAWKAYLEHPDAGHVRKATKMNAGTVLRLIEKGYPRYGVPPFKERIAVSRSTLVPSKELAAAIVTELPGTETLDALLNLRQNLGRMNAIITHLAEGTLRMVKEGDFKPKDPVAALKAIASALKTSTEIEAMLSLLAQPIEGAEARGAEEIFGGWTPEELLSYATTGEWPAGKRGPAESRAPVQVQAQVH